MYKGSDYNHKNITRKGNQSVLRRGKRKMRIGKKLKKLVKKLKQSVKFVLSDATCDDSEKEDFLDWIERKYREVIDMVVTPKFEEYEYDIPANKEYFSLENDINVNLDINTHEIKHDPNSPNYETEDIYDINDYPNSIENDNYGTPAIQENPYENYNSPENYDNPINPNGEDYLYYGKNIDQFGLDPEIKKKLNKKHQYKKLKHKKLKKKKSLKKANMTKSFKI